MSSSGGNNREPTFAAAADFQFYLDVLREASERHGLRIHAYVLMTNHVHLLATPEGPSSLPKTLQSLGRRYVQYLNYTYGRTGTLWEGRYRATVIDTERYLLTRMRYIELNPVRAGMVTRPGERFPDCGDDLGRRINSSLTLISLLLATACICHKVRHH